MRELSPQEKIIFYSTSLATIRKDFDNQNRDYSFEDIAVLTGLSISSVKAQSIYEDRERFSKQFFRNRSNGLIPARYVYKHIFSKLRGYQHSLYCVYRNNVFNYGYVPRTFKEFLVGDIITSELLDTQKYCRSTEVMEILNISISSLRSYCERQIFKKHEYFAELYERTEILKYKNRDLECNLKLCAECGKKLNYLSFDNNNILCNKCNVTIEKKMLIKQINVHKDSALKSIENLKQKIKEAELFSDRFTQFYKRDHKSGGMRFGFDHIIWHINYIQKSKLRTYYAAPDMIYSKDNSGVVNIHIISNSTGVKNHYLRMLEKFIESVEEEYLTLENFYSYKGFCEIIVLSNGTHFTHNHFAPIDKEDKVENIQKPQLEIRQQTYYSQEEVVKLTGFCVSTIYKYADTHLLPRSNNGKFSKENVDIFISMKKESEYYGYSKDCVTRGIMPVGLSEYMNGDMDSNLLIDDSYCSYEYASSILHVTKASVVRNVELGYIQTHPELKGLLVEKKSLMIFHQKQRIKKIKRVFSKKKKVLTDKKLKTGYTLLEGYGTSTKEINLLRFRSDEQSTGKIIYTCQFILKHKKTKFIQLLLEKALLRMEVVEKMKNMDHEMSVTGYRFDF